MQAREITSDKDLAKTIVRVAGVVGLDAVICLTESGELAKELVGINPDLRIIAATADPQVYEELDQLDSDLELVRMPIHGLDKYHQVRHVLSIALKAGSISIGDFVLTALGRDACPKEGNLIVLGDVEAELEELSVKDLLKLTDGIRPAVLDAVMEVAGKIGRVVRRGKQVGTIFTLGDSLEVLDRCEQLIPNPFRGHEESARRITDAATHDAVIELAKLDGAFVIRGDGLIQTAGAFLCSGSDESQEEMQGVREKKEKLHLTLPEGLGARHVAAAAITARTEATAIVVSATDGNIRVFAGGEMVLKMDPSINYGPIEEDG